RVNVDYRNTNVLLPKTYGGFLRGSLVVLVSPINPNANYKIFIPFDINKPMLRWHRTFEGTIKWLSFKNNLISSFYPDTNILREYMRNESDGIKINMKIYETLNNPNLGNRREETFYTSGYVEDIKVIGTDEASNFKIYFYTEPTLQETGGNKYITSGFKIIQSGISGIFPKFYVFAKTVNTDYEISLL
ncbi:MAG: hypothetical protein ACLTXO_12465, partial [Fusobacterium varium]|uniref:hypothetical protein n=1 Tax=Fusobacterium varium TaxID=856 RepID=UPI0039968FB5